jgi:hypothetical protein
MEKKKLPAPIIKTYDVEPPVLDQCPSCTHAVFTKFEPKGCPEIEAVRTLVATCQENHDVFAESICNSFRAGMPQNGISLPLLAFA